MAIEPNQPTNPTQPTHSAQPVQSASVQPAPRFGFFGLPDWPGLAAALAQRPVDRADARWNNRGVKGVVCHCGSDVSLVRFWLIRGGGNGSELPKSVLVLL